MHAVLTGPIQGEKTLLDGTTYDVSPQLVYVQSPEHAAELVDLIGLHYTVNGHPAVEGRFVYDKLPINYEAPSDASTSALVEA